MNHFEWTFPGEAGVALWGQGWAPEHPRAVVLLFHGLGEHSGRYAHVAANFAKQGLATIAIDHYGHGKTTGTKGHIPRWDLFFECIDKVRAEAVARFGNIPQFLYGHSMGGCVVASYLTTQRPLGLAGIVLSAPALKIAFEPSPFMIGLGKLMINIFPGFTQPNGLDVKGLSHDQKVIDAYLADPLVHNKVSALLGLGILSKGKESIANASGYNSVPLLIMHGADDPVTSPAGSEEFAVNYGKLCTFKKWQGLFHEIHNEPQQEEVLHYATDWMLSHMQPTS